MSYAAPNGLPLRRRPRSGLDRAASVAMLLLLLLIGTATGALGVALSLGAGYGWYPAVPRVNWAPPRGVLATVRAVISVALAVAAWLVWRRRAERPVGGPLILFVAQSVLSTAWPVLFYAGYGVFGLTDLWLTFGLQLVLDLVLVATAIAFWSVSRVAGVVVALQLVATLISTALALGSAGMHAVL